MSSFPGTTLCVCIQSILVAVLFGICSPTNVCDLHNCFPEYSNKVCDQTANTAAKYESTRAKSQEQSLVIAVTVIGKEISSQKNPNKQKLKPQTKQKNRKEKKS